MYPFDAENYINVVSVDQEPEEPTPTPTVAPKPTIPAPKPLTDEEKLSKKACIDKENNCNVGFKPYSMFEFNDVNPTTNKKGIQHQPIHNSNVKSVRKLFQQNGTWKTIKNSSHVQSQVNALYYQNYLHTLK